MNSDAILSFWFFPPGRDRAAVDTRMERWFVRGRELDTEIDRHFADSVAAAATGAFDAAAGDGRTRLALILLLDQFPRHLYRGTARAFAADERALALAEDGVAAGLDAGLEPLERGFFVMPYQHAESLAAQRRSVERFATVRDGAPAGPERVVLDRFVESAREHHDIIERFGRFPHRNRALGRASTPDEEAWLSAGARSFGQ